MDARQERGIAIAKTQTLVKNENGLWYVPAQSSSHKKYSVRIGKNANESFCSCPDFENGFRCKHLHAVEFKLTQTTVTKNKDGSVTATTATLTLKTTPERKSYAQPWAQYNAAQVNERGHFNRLLTDLCATLPEKQRKPGCGRKPVSYRDGLFSAILKVHSTFSARRFSGELKEAHENGYIGRLPHFNSVLNVFDDAAVTPLLKDMVRVSALPLAAVETKIAIDSSGFSASKFDRWFDEKHGTPRSRQVWVKAHIATGCLTNCVIAADVLDSYTGDSTQFPPLVKESAASFPELDFVADCAYASGENFQLVDDLGQKLYTQFKRNATGGIGGVYGKMFHLFSFKKDEYLKEYHARSNIESTFSAVKRIFGDSVRSKNLTAMKNEVYAKFVAHNLRCLIMEMYVLGIDPRFATGCTNLPTPAHFSQVSG
jgi:predicted nucleic acid-binding Zn finger protein